MKRVLNGREIGQIYETPQDFDNFYDELKKGALPTTTQINSYEAEEYFADVLQKEKEGDIIHIALSGGLSGTCDNCRAAAEKLSAEIKGRKIYVVDSLIATGGIEMLIDRLIPMRENDIKAEEAVKRIGEIRDRQQGWFVVDDLFHLKRGGRISGFKAAIGALLNIKPVVTVSKSGRLAIENTVKGTRKAIKYLINKIEELGVDVLREEFFKNPVYLIRTSKNENYDELKREFLNKYPDAVIKETIIGPIVGTHVGGGAAAVIFEGSKRLDI